MEAETGPEVVSSLSQQKEQLPQVVDTEMRDPSEEEKEVIQEKVDEKLLSGDTEMLELSDEDRHEVLETSSAESVEAETKPLSHVAAKERLRILQEYDAHMWVATKGAREAEETNVQARDEDETQCFVIDTTRTKVKPAKSKVKPPASAPSEVSDTSESSSSSDTGRDTSHLFMHEVLVNEPPVESLDRRGRRRRTLIEREELKIRRRVGRQHPPNSAEFKAEVTRLLLAQITAMDQKTARREAKKGIKKSKRADRWAGRGNVQARQRERRTFRSPDVPPNRGEGSGANAVQPNKRWESRAHEIPRPSSPKKVFAPLAGLKLKRVKPLGKVA
jgi:hypothetical protein